MTPASRRAIEELQAFEPTREEHLDVDRLYTILERLDKDDAPSAIPVMLGVFERCPDALLGSPGPLVHCIESTGMETYLAPLLASFRRAPNRMTWRMISRLERSTSDPALLQALLATLRTVREQPHAAALRENIEELLAAHPRACVRST